ncbi:MAG: hypothetical protein AAFX99_28155 [Myxococcota bacterium]
MKTLLNTAIACLLTLGLSAGAVSTAYACGPYGMNPIQEQHRVVWLLESEVERAQDDLDAAVDRRDMEAITEIAVRLKQLRSDLKAERVYLNHLKQSELASR